jgi:serine/threonine protein kinase
MEYFAARDLHTYLVDGKRPPLPEADCCQITSQVLWGLNLMHRAGFTHCDIKPQVRVLQETMLLCNVALSKGLTPGTRMF